MLALPYFQQQFVIEIGACDRGVGVFFLKMAIQCHSLARH
jgi:hypothetical protein